MSLHAEVCKFEEWASTLSPQEPSGEWEYEYERWGELRFTAKAFLASSTPEDWRDEDIADLLYAIARDNEMELLAEEIGKDETTLLALSSHALTSRESDAKWQLEVQLGNVLDNTKEAEAILLKLVRDENEYVSRRSLLCLGKMKSVHAEELAGRAWETGHEYQRIVALWVLKEVSSPRLSDYIAKAMEDGRESVVRRAIEVRGHAQSAQPVSKGVHFA